jgi:two-component system chemotaxis response regulator CheB
MTMSKRRLQILVVDDSAFMRLLLTDLISEDDDLQVVGSAVNGLEAAGKVAELSPDVVLLDLNMAEYDGLFAVKKIMAEKPTPILILSSVGNTDLSPIFEALKFGAVDYMNKPDRNNFKMRTMHSELMSKIKAASRAKPRTLPDKSAPKKVVSSKRKSNYDLVVIGASTGGPSAIEQIITDLPADFNVPVIVCQHMPTIFITPFVNRLNSLTDLNVVTAVKSMNPTAGTIMVCPGHANTVLLKSGTRTVVDFDETVYREYNNPSINALMRSVAKTYGDKAIGVLLTGMGKDGVEGLKEIKEAGGYTIAQDKESCIIYGMPKVAVERGAVIKSLDIKEIGDYIVNNL